jgi:hypothetical protein
MVRLKWFLALPKQTWDRFDKSFQHVRFEDIVTQTFKFCADAFENSLKMYRISIHGNCYSVSNKRVLISGYVNKSTRPIGGVQVEISRLRCSI